MKKLFLALALLLPSLALGQGARFNGTVTNQRGEPVSGASVYVCTSVGVGIPCTPLTNVYSDVGLTTPILQPLTTDSYGRYGFWATAGAQLIVSVTGRFVTSYSFPVTMPGGGSGGGGSIFQVNNTSLLTSTTVNYINSTPFNGLTFTFTNPSAGIVQLGATGTLANSGLTNSSVTVSTSGPLVGGGTVALGGTLTLSCPTCTAGSPPTLSTLGTNNSAQNALNFIASTTNTIGLTTTPANPSAGNEKEEITGTLLPLGGGTGIASPTAHRLPITEGASNFTLLSMAADTLLQGQGSGVDPAALAVANCGGADAYSTGTHSFVCNAIPANTNSVTHQFFTAYNSTSGAFTQAQPAYTDISGTPTLYYQTVQVGGTPQTQEATANYVAGTNMTITPSLVGGVTTLTFTSSATSATAFSALTSATNTNTGTFAATGNTWDFTGSTLFKLRVGSSLTTSANGDLAYDTSNKNWHAWDNGADSLVGIWSAAPTNGDCVSAQVAGGVVTLLDAGGSCSTGSTSAFASLTAGTNSNSGTFTATGNSWNFTGATIFKLRAAASVTSSANGDLAYDTSNKNWHAWDNGGDALVGIWASTPSNGDCVSAQVSSGTVTLLDAGGSCSTGSTSAFSSLTAGTNSNAGSFIATGNTWDFTGSTIFKLRSHATATTSANGDIAYDTTNKNWHAWTNASDLLMGIWTSTPTNGDCVSANVSAGVVLLNDFGAACGGTSLNWNTLTAGTNSNAGTFAASGNTWSFTGTTLFKLRAGAALTTTVNGDIGYDTTNTMWHGWNGADSFFFQGLIAGTFTNNDCPKIAKSGSQITLVDSGAGCGGTGTVTSFSAGNANPLFTTSVATATTTPALTFTLTSQNANQIFASPASGGAGTPSWRAMVAADLPATFNATTATALAATPSLCPVGQAAGGVVASGNATECQNIGTATYPFASLNVTGNEVVGGNVTATSFSLGGGSTLFNFAAPGGTCTSGSVFTFGICVGDNTLGVTIWDSISGTVRSVTSQTSNLIAQNIPVATGIRTLGTSQLTDTGTTMTYAGSGGIVASAGPINSQSDGTHAGRVSLVGNTTAPALPSNSISWIAPNSASFTAYGLQLPATGPSGSNNLMTCAAPVAGVSACTFSSSSTGVLSVSGDGTLISNSASTGTVTLTLGTAGAHKYFGNNTSSTAAPAYYQPAFTDLSGLLACGQFPALTGDTTTSAGSCATTTAKLNGVSLAGLASGVLYNTTSTGAPSIATAAQMDTAIGTLPIANGGTNATSAPSAGAIPNSSSTTAASWTVTPTLGLSGTAGTLTMYNNTATTTWASGATTSNTIKGFTVAPTTLDLIECTTASTTCTLTDTGILTANVVTQASNGAAGQIATYTGASKALTASSTPTLGASGTAGTLAMFPASGNFTTTLGSAATASNTVDFFASAPTTGDIIKCVTSSTTCTLTDAAILAANIVVASSPGAGVAHFAGSTQTVTSSAVTPSDATGNTSGSGNFALVTSPSFTTPSLGAATATSLLATGIVDGTAPITVTTGATATLGGTYNSGYTFNQDTTAATAITYTLPTAAAGKQYCVSNSYGGAADTGTIELLTSAAGQYIIFTDGTLSATGGYVISGGAAADAACVVGVDSTHWQLYLQRGTWAKH